jgi:hypothetical protein
MGGAAVLVEFLENAADAIIPLVTAALVIKKLRRVCLAVILRAKSLLFLYGSENKTRAIAFVYH